MIRSLIKKKFPAARLALTVGLGGSLLAANAAFAQVVNNPDATTSTATPADATGPADRVIVTGSNIPTAAEAGTARIDTVDEAARDRTGQQDVLSVLQRADPSFSGGGNLGSSNASISSGSTYGGSAVSIHGLPTLVLLNGRRVADSAAQAAGGSAFVDVNLFPTALIKRIEVLKDGASAIYGSEAIGGVVNVILNQEFRGLEIDGRYGFTEKSDIKDKRVSAIVGLGDDKTSIVIGGQYTEQDPIFNRDREWAGPSFGTNSFNGNIRLNGQFYFLNNGVTDPTQVTGNGTIGTAAGLAGSGAYRGPLSSGADSQLFDLSRGTGITLDQSRLSLFGEFAREIWADHITVYGEFLYSHNYTQSYLNAQPITGLSTDAANNGLIIPVGALGNPFNFVVDFNVAATGITDVASPGVPVGTNVGRVDVRARFTDFPRIFRSDTDFYRVVAGLKGVILPSIDLRYDISFNTSQNEINYRNSNLPIVANLNAGIANGTINIFSTADQTAALTAAGVFGANFRDLKSALNVFDAGVTLFPVKLPAGPLGLAFGYEYRFEKFRYDDSPEIFLGSVPVPGINTGRDIHAAYAEMSIPVISPTMKIPGVYSLDLDGAVRMEKYEGIHSSFVPKASFVYRPIEDIAVRGSFSKSFIAPTLLETNGPVSSGFSNSIDLGQGAEQSFEQGGSNPALSPSTADTYSIGLVISPKQVPGLTISGDFFHVEQKNIVGTIPDVTIANSVNDLGPASPFSNLVRHFGFNGAQVTAPGQLAGNLGDYYITDNLVNIGRVRIGGIDFNLNYTHDFDKGGPARFGILTFGLNGIYYLQDKNENLPGDRAYDTVGTYLGQANSVPDYKLAPYVEYRWGGFKASALANYTPSLRDAHSIDISTYRGPDKDGYLPKIRDYYTIDLLFAYTFGLNKPDAPPAPMPTPKDGKDGGKQVVSKEVAKKMMTSPRWLDGLSLGFGITNVTNARPPFIANSPDSTNTDAALYDPYQRLYYFTIEKKF